MFKILLATASLILTSTSFATDGASRERFIQLVSTIKTFGTKCDVKLSIKDEIAETALGNMPLNYVELQFVNKKNKKIAIKLVGDMDEVINTNGTFSYTLTGRQVEAVEGEAGSPLKVESFTLTVNNKSKLSAELITKTTYLGSAPTFSNELSYLCND